MRGLMLALVLSLMAISTTSCAGLATPQAQAHATQLREDIARLDQDLLKLQAALTPALAAAPEIVDLLAAAGRRDYSSALNGVLMLSADVGVIDAEIRAALDVIEVDLRAILEDLRALARDARGRGEDSPAMAENGSGSPPPASK